MEKHPPSPTSASAFGKARLPRGFVDQQACDLRATHAMLEVIRSVYELYGFEPLETPILEYADSLGKYLPDQDRPNAGVFSCQDDDGQWLSLRYDLTAPLARRVAAYYDSLPKPYRSYRVGPVFRNEKPGPGRFRQFMQFDADIVGSSHPAADAELCMMAVDTLEALGIERGKYVLKLNHRKILEGVLEGIGLQDTSQSPQRLIVLRALDKIDRLGEAGVRLLLGEGRRDESGDFTQGAGLSTAQIEQIMAFVNARSQNTEETLSKLEASVLHSNHGRAGVQDLREIYHLYQAAGYGSDQIEIDPSVVRGLEYYTGAVFEAELTFEVKDEQENEVRFGSVGGGGRYDHLVSRLREDHVPATGFSIGVSRLYAALKALHIPHLIQGEGGTAVLILVLDPDHMPRYQNFAQQLRKAGIATEVYMGQGGMNAQLKYADRRGCACAVIQGSQEREASGGPTLLLKDLRLGAQLSSMTKDREAYLALRERVQKVVPEDQFISHVKSILGIS